MKRVALFLVAMVLSFQVTASAEVVADVAVLGGGEYGIQGVASFASFVVFGIAAGSFLEWRSAPERFGKFPYNGHEIKDSHSVKWENDPEHPGWKRLKRYDNAGPGIDRSVPERHKFDVQPQGSALDRVGSL